MVLEQEATETKAALVPWKPMPNLVLVEPKLDRIGSLVLTRG